MLVKDGNIGTNGVRFDYLTISLYLEYFFKWVLVSIWPLVNFLWQYLQNFLLFEEKSMFLFKFDRQIITGNFSFYFPANLWCRRTDLTDGIEKRSWKRTRWRGEFLFLIILKFERKIIFEFARLGTFTICH